MKPIQTSFSFSTAYPTASYLGLSIEPCGHIPSPDELAAAPFYSDHSQRILVFYLGQYGTCHTINAELLLGLAQEGEGQDVGWDEWGIHTIEVHVRYRGGLGKIWVSGCRMFCTMSNGADDDNPTYLRIYDFSHAGRAKHLRTLDKAREGGGTRRLSPSLGGYKLPWTFVGSWGVDLTIGHDSLAFRVVSILTFLFAVE